VVDQKVGSPAVEDHPLVKSLRAILKELDDQYERERQNLIATLPNTGVKDRALAMLESRHHQRRENYSRELAALLEQRSADPFLFNRDSAELPSLTRYHTLA
jgi:hypothetical protein